MKKTLYILALLCCANGAMRATTPQEIMQDRSMTNGSTGLIKCYIDPALKAGSYDDTFFIMAAPTGESLNIAVGGAGTDRLHHEPALSRLLSLGSKDVVYNDAKICWACRLVQDQKLSNTCEPRWANATQRGLEAEGYRQSYDRLQSRISKFEIHNPSTGNILYTGICPDNVI